MWIEHDDQLFNIARIVHIACVGTLDIALYDQIDELDRYLLLSFDSVRERNHYYSNLKNLLKKDKNGQENKKHRKTRKKDFEEFEEP